jgi:protein O-mannosyl-transferase
MLNKINISPQKQILFVYITLAVVTLAVFWQVNQYGFVNFDDEVYVTDNSHIQSGITLDGLRWAFSTTEAEFWHPLTWLSLMLDHQLYYLNAGGYHLTNLILHIMSALLLFWLFNRMTGVIWRSAFVAALFALHPLHVESVAWIAERKDVLSAFFWMLTLCLYVYYTEKPVIKRYLLVLFCFACALMSKPMVITLPIVMILLDYWPLGRLQSQEILTTTDIALVAAKKGKKKNKSEKEALKKNISPPRVQKLSEPRIAGIVPLWQLREKTPFFILSAIFVIITLLAQQNPTIKNFPLGSRFANAPVSFVTYLEKTFWPHDLAFFYPFSEQLPVWQVLGAVILIIVITIAVIAVVKRLPYLFVGWLWYAVTLLPVIGIVRVGVHAMADRYTYLPSIGIAIMLAWGIPLLFRRKDIRKILFPAGIAFLTIVAVLTWKQCGYWKNSVTLFNHALQVTTNNYITHTNLASVLLGEGKVEKAIEHYNEAIRIKSDEAYPYFGRGLAYFRLGQQQHAIEDYSEAIRLKPDFADAYNSRGKVYAKIGQYQPAIEDFNKTINLDQNYSDAYINRAVIYLNHRNNAFGCLDAQKACELGNCRILEMAQGRGDCR